MKKLWIVLLVPILLVGCANNKFIKKDVKEKFEQENYESIPEVKNIVHYLKLDSKDVKVLNETNQELTFSFNYEDQNNNGEYVDLVYDYAKMLEEDGYQSEVYDATISSTIKLTKHNIEMNITHILDIDDWKKYNNQYSIDDENTICKIFVYE